MELGIGISLVVVVVFLAVYFGVRQRATLAQMRSDEQLSPDDRTYYVKQIRRRLLCSILLLLLAGMLVGSFFLNDAGTRALAEGEVVPQEVKDSVRFLTGYWICALFVLLAVMLVASFDFLATARYGLKRVRQLENDRRTTLEMEAARLRRRRQELN